MPRKRWIDKKNAQTYQLVFRPQDDPLIHDENAGERTLFQVSGPASSAEEQRQHAGLHLTDLERDVDLDSIRENEGEAAQYGIYFDDTQYDYMQHLRDLGEGGGDTHLIDALPVKIQGKGKGKGKQMRLEDALREVSLADEQEEVPSLYDSKLDDDFSTFSRSTRPKTYQDQQEVPDEIAGFQPDMDPRLREALEALEDDAYVDENDEEDVFGALVNDGKNGELDLNEFEANLDEDEGWESDVTEKATAQAKQLEIPPMLEASIHASGESTMTNDMLNAESAAAEDGDWLRNFAKYKRDTIRKAPPQAAESILAASAVNDRAPTLYTLNGTPLRQKKRKGAMTNPSAYSMTSSSLARTEGQQLLDARFDQIEKMYALDEAGEFEEDMGEDISVMSGMTSQSKMSQLSTTSFADKAAVRGDFDSMLDGFLGDWEKAHPSGGKRKGGKAKRGKNGNEKIGLQQLEELRAELGPARISPKLQKA